MSNHNNNNNNNNVEVVLNTAKYNEVVTLQQENGEEVSLVQVLDRQNGGLMWQALPNAERALQRHLQTKTWLFPMLNDVDRNYMYEQAIRKACLKLKVNKEDIDDDDDDDVLVLDIGSGTGLLALMVDRYAPSNVSDIISVEMASPMVSLASQHIQENREHNMLQRDRIKIVEGHSCADDFILPRKAKMCTSELLESGLLNEGIVPAMRDAWERHLSDDAICVPCGARVYAQLIEGNDSVASYTSVRSKENDLLQITANGSSNGRYTSKGSKLLHIHANKLLDLEDVKLLSDPREVLSFDFSSRDRLPPLGGREEVVSFKATSSGKIQAILFWWELDLDKDLVYSTKASDSGQSWQDHWLQNIFVFSPCDFTPITQGRSIELCVLHNDFSISFSFQSSNGLDATPLAMNIDEGCKLISKFSGQRIKQLNDRNRIAFYEESISNSLKAHNEGVSVLDLSDFSICGVIAAKLKARVTSIESSSGEIPLLSAHLAQVGNQLTDGNSFQILNVYPEQLTNQYIFDECANIVMAEPYYEKLEGFSIVESMNYFYLVKSVKARGLVSNNALSVPSRARIYACAIESMSLRNAYAKLNGRCAGFSHSAVDKSRGGKLDVCVPLSQYQYRVLVAAFQVACFQYSGLPISLCGQWEGGKVFSNGKCDAIVLWVDYENTGQQKISTFDRYHNQYVRILNETPNVRVGDKIYCKFDIEDIDCFEDFEIAVKFKQNQI